MTATRKMATDGRQTSKRLKGVANEETKKGCAALLRRASRIPCSCAVVWPQAPIVRSATACGWRRRLTPAADATDHQ
jgi:hypothetical protein